MTPEEEVVAEATRLVAATAESAEVEVAEERLARLTELRRFLTALPDTSGNRQLATWIDDAIERNSTVSSRKQRGHDTQRIVAEYLRGHGFPHAESAGAGRQGSDVTGCLGLDIEVKARRDLNLPGMMRQLADRTVDGVLGVGVVRGDGQGPATIEDWPVVLRLADAVLLLRAAGYGDPLPQAPPPGVRPRNPAHTPENDRKLLEFLDAVDGFTDEQWNQALTAARNEARQLFRDLAAYVRATRPQHGGEGDAA
jgi:hypothetical protein